MKQLISHEIQILSSNQRLRSIHGPQAASIFERIKNFEISLSMSSNRDIDIEKGREQLRIREEERIRELKMEEEKRLQYSQEHVTSLMEIFKTRDRLNVMFKRKFGFRLLKLHEEGVLAEIVSVCRSEKDFVNKILALGNLIDWMEVDRLKSRCQVKKELSGSINILEDFLEQNIGNIDLEIIKNLRIIKGFRNKKSPIHMEGEELIELFGELGSVYPVEDWDFVWKEVMKLYEDSLLGLIRLLGE